MYNCFNHNNFCSTVIVDCSLSPLCPLPIEKFSRYDLQPITEQQDPTALLYPVISFFMSLEWWHEQMTFHPRVKQVYIQNTLHLSLSELMRCLGGGGGNIKMEGFQPLLLPPSDSVTFVSRKCINFVKTNWSLICIISSTSNVDFNWWKYRKLIYILSIEGGRDRGIFS